MPSNLGTDQQPGWGGSPLRGEGGGGELSGRDEGAASKKKNSLRTIAMSCANASKPVGHNDTVFFPRPTTCSDHGVCRSPLLLNLFLNEMLLPAKEGWGVIYGSSPAPFQQRYGLLRGSPAIIFV